MRGPLQALSLAPLALLTSQALAASWQVVDFKGSVAARAGRDASTIAFDFGSNLKETITLGDKDTLVLDFFTQVSDTKKRPHQTHLILEDNRLKLATTYAVVVRDSGKATFRLSLADIPTQLLQARRPLSLSLAVGSFDDAMPVFYEFADINFDVDSNELPEEETPTRFSPLPHVTHTFKQPQVLPYKPISAAFTVIAVGGIPILIGLWAAIGANVGRFSKAIGNAPVAHIGLAATLVSLEGLLFIYWTSLRLHQLLLAASGLGVVAFLTGRKTLTEVQRNRKIS